MPKNVAGALLVKSPMPVDNKVGNLRNTVPHLLGQLSRSLSA